MIEILNFQIKILPFVIGAGVAFFGWTAYWLSINVSGATLGGTLGAGLGAGIALLLGRLELFLPLVIVLGLVGIVIGILLIRKLHRLAFFLTGCALGVLVGEPIMLTLRNAGIYPFEKLWTEILLKVGIGIAGGLLLVRFNRYVVCVLTAAVGAVILMSSWDFKGGVLPGLPIFLWALFVQVYLLRKKGKIPPLRNPAED